MNPFVQLLVLALYICFFPILFFIPSLYYPLVRFGFEIGNFFRKRHFLPKVTDPLLLISATKAAELIRNKELKSVDLVNAYICRIKEVNCILNALISDCFQEALKEAAKVDQFMESVDKNSDEVRKLEKEKPLFGIPFTIKDSMDVKGREITIGMPIRQGLISKEDADVVKNTRESGGILLGITNVPECLMSYETHNPIFGVTNNPYDTRRSPGGSSGDSFPPVDL
ncbi:hypothetical protein L596_006856 [Steinernema carpocapsae]|uniref:Amidase domain-containing protein n=1 Tax=Steinernema carpocapsae TaxID=34508 RepID=A0A4V6A5R5_STECR|nr:hypothetical protein L596_006856 [Steinernema carpocapsae]